MLFLRRRAAACRRLPLQAQRNQRAKYSSFQVNEVHNRGEKAREQACFTPDSETLQTPEFCCSSSFEIAMLRMCELTLSYHVRLISYEL